MPANGTITTAASIDSAAVSLSVAFNTGSSEGYAGPRWTASEVRRKIGTNASTAIVEIPLSGAEDESAPSVALVGTSAVQMLRIGTKACVWCSAFGKDGLVFNGSVVNISQALSGDYAQVTLWDHRYLLDGLKVIGQYHVSAKTGVSYRQGWRCQLNPGGRPNCTLAGGHPVFCPPGWGLSDGADPGTTPTEGAACYWTPVTFLEYLHWVFTEGNVTAATKFPFCRTLPTDIDWPKGFASAISGDGANKKIERDFEGMKLTDAIQEALKSAGPYALYMTPTGEYTQELRVVGTRYNTESGITILRGGVGHARDTMQLACVTEGNFEVDGSEAYTEFAVAGDLAYVETRVDTYDDQTLVKAWTDEEESAFKAIIKDGIEGVTKKTTKAFLTACTKYPKVFAAYKILETYDFQASTPCAGYPRADIMRPPLPVLLSTYMGKSGGTQSEQLTDNVPITIEIKIDGGENEWKVANRLDGLRLDPDGTIWLEGLRLVTSSPSPSEYCSWVGSLSDPDNMTSSDLRATFAIPCDHRVVGHKTIYDDADTVRKEENALIDSGLRRTFYADAEGLYQLHAQHNSYPVPEAAGGEYENNTLRDDRSAIAKHALARREEYGRLSKSGRLAYPTIYPGLHPGHQIHQIAGVGVQPYIVNAVVQEVVLRVGTQTNVTEVILG